MENKQELTIKMDRELVIAAYDKDLSWTSEINEGVKVTVYRKGDVLPLSKNEISIEPNVGRCVHTFFYHIYNNYNRLSDITFFVQEYPFDHVDNIIDIVNNFSTSEPNMFLKEGYKALYTGKSIPLSKSDYFQCGTFKEPSFPAAGEIHKHWEYLFKGDHLEYYEFVPAGHFMATRSKIKERSREFYGELVNLLEVGNSHIPHVIERFELYIFDSKFKTYK